MISPILLNFYSDYMMKETVENMSGITINGQNVTNLRYAEDTVLITLEEIEELKKLQNIIDKLQEVCMEYCKLNQDIGHQQR